MSARVQPSDVAALFSRQPDRVVPDLERITTLCELLGRPDQAFPAIHLTGTNGKTTTSRMVTSLIGALGLSAGTYTSPHLQDVTERIRVAGEPISAEDFSALLGYLAPFLAEVDSRSIHEVTFFEVLTAMAFVHFADVPVDVGVIEVGMGGRWDATNLVRGEVAVLTPIALDHPELGPDVVSVAGEKAGIIKQGAVVVSARQAPKAAEVVEAAVREQGAQLVLAGRDFDVVERGLAVGGQVLTLRGVTGEVADVYVPLHGEHQAANAACALAAVEAFLGFAGGIDADVVRTGFAAVTSPGRLEVVRHAGRPAVVLDGAHNPAGAQTLALALQHEFAFRSRIFVLGMLGDKDVDGVAAALAPVADHVVVTEPATPRAAPAERIEQALARFGVRSELADDVDDALDLATGVAGPLDAVVVTGSLYVVGAARTALGLPPA